MMGNTQKEQEEGQKILNNYKKQLAEKLAREASESTGLFDRPKPTSSQNTKRSIYAKSMGTSFSSSKTKQNK